MFASARAREIGRLDDGLRSCQSRAYGNDDLVERLERTKRLEGHAGCVNTVGFSDDGEVVITGSDDQRIILWNCYTGNKVLSYSSGHSNNIFQARFLPNTNNATVVSCAADGQVRVGYLHQSGTEKVTTSMLATHGRRAHKLALDPQAPHCFYSCGEDGRVFHYDLRCSRARQSLLICTMGRAHGVIDRLALNSIHCNPLRPWQFMVAGSDTFARIYDQRRSLTPDSSNISAPSDSPASIAAPVRKLAPRHLSREPGDQLFPGQAWHITCAVFSQRGEALATYNDESIYLFKSEGPTVCRDTHWREASNLRKRPGRQRSESGVDLSPSPTTRRLRSPEAERRQESADPPAAREVSARQSDGHDVPHMEHYSPDLTGPPTRAAAVPDTQDFIGPMPNLHGNADAFGGEARGDETSQLQPNSAEVQDLRVQGDQSRELSGGAFGSEVAPGSASFSSGHTSQSCSSQGSSQDSTESSQEASSGHSGSGSSDCDDAPPWDSESLSSSGDDLARVFMSDLVEDMMTSERHARGLQEARRESADANIGAAGIEASEDMGPCNGSQDADPTQSTFDDDVVMTYRGHRNKQTVKGVSFLGADDRYVMSGSDDGHIYIWTTADGILRQWLQGDSYVVNCLEPHPCQPMSFATSGIDDDVKLWSPTSADRKGVPPRAASIIQNNTRHRERRMPSAEARNLIARITRLAQSEEFQRPATEPRVFNIFSPEYGPRQAVGGGARSAQESVDRGANSGQQLEDSDVEGEYPQDGPGGCVIA